MGEETESEKRLRGVEEAVIEFKQIAKYVIVEHAQRIKSLEDDVDNIKTTLYESCDIKTKEIADSKLAVLRIVGYVAGLGLAATVYFNAHTSTLEANISTIKTIQENRNTQISNILSKLDNLSDKIDTHNKGDK